MEDSNPNQGPVLRLFLAKAKDGEADALLAKFATTSADVVHEKPGNAGYFFGKGIAIDNDRLVFASFWKDIEAVKQRFGENWQSSYLPEGYEAFIDECSVQHFDLGSSWFILGDA